MADVRYGGQKATIDSAKFECGFTSQSGHLDGAIGQGSGEQFLAFQNHCPCYATRHSLFFGVGNFAEIADFTINSGRE